VVTRQIKDVILKELHNKNDETLVKFYVKHWKRFTICVHYMRKLLDYLNRYHLKNNNGVNLATTALNLFRDQCFASIKDRLRTAILNQISRDRNNEYVDLDVLKTAIYTFVQLGYIHADIKGENGVYEWSGDKNNEKVYVVEFQNQLIAKVRLRFLSYWLVW